MIIIIASTAAVPGTTDSAPGGSSLSLITMVVPIVVVLLAVAGAVWARKELVPSKRPGGPTTYFHRLIRRRPEPTKIGDVEANSAQELTAYQSR